MWSGGHNLRSSFVQRVWEHAVSRKDNGALHQVLQLANVARPGIPLEGSHGFRRNVVDLLPDPTAEHLDEMRDQSRNVFPALSKRGQQDGEDIQTIIQITAKLPASYHLHEIPIGRCYQPDFHLVRATAP